MFFLWKGFTKRCDIVKPQWMFIRGIMLFDLDQEIWKDKRSIWKIKLIFLSKNNTMRESSKSLFLVWFIFFFNFKNVLKFFSFLYSYSFHDLISDYWRCTMESWMILFWQIVWSWKYFKKKKKDNEERRLMSGPK